MPEAVLLLPCYNESKNLARVLPGLEPLRGKLDIVFVNDGSKDDTANILEQRGYRVISHPQNRGYAATIRTALSHALSSGYAYACLMDSDGQHDPSYVLKAFETAKTSGADLVIGSRFVENTQYRSTLSRQTMMRLFSWMTLVFGGQRIHDTTSGFKVMNRKVMTLALNEAFVDFHAEFIIYLLKARCKIVEMPIVVGQREHGRSMYTWKSYVVYPLKMLVRIARVVMTPAKRELP